MLAHTDIWIDSLEQRLKSYQPYNPSTFEPIYREAIEQAIIAARQGNFGVGAVICDQQGKILAKGHNEVFFPYVRSDAHAEMITMNRFEQQYQEQIRSGELDLGSLVLVTTLEPCVMCAGRLLISGINKIIYLALDRDFGGMSALAHFKKPYKLFLDKTTFVQAEDCPTELQTLSNDVFLNHPLLHQQLDFHGSNLQQTH